MKACLTSALLATLLIASARVGAAGETSADATVSPAALQNSSSGETLAYSSEQLLADLSRELTNRYRTNGELQLELIRAWSPFDASVGPVTMTVLDAPSVLSSSLLIRVRFSAGAKTLGETSLFVRAQLFRDVWVIRNAPEHGASLDPSEMDTRRVDTLKERDTVAVSDPTGELTFSRSIPAGRLVTWHDVSRRALVRKGQVIEVSAIDGMLTVNMKALAMENGSAGETVRVRNMDTKKEFTAQVIAESRAVVRL